MSYQKKNIQKTNSGSSSVSEAVALRKGFSFPAVPALQRQGAEDELQMKKIPAQLMEEEEPLQGKFDTVQKAEEEEPLQGKFNTIQKVEEEEPLQGKFETVQKVEEEEPLQGKFDTIQKAEEEEPLQGKFETVQKVEEEEPLQGKFDTIQKVEEEEPLQGKFETVQKVEEEEPLQGKFDTIQKVEDEEPLQGKFATKPFAAVQLKSANSGSENINPVQREEASGQSNKTGLPDSLKSGVENLSGFSLDDVKVHYNSSKPAQLHAHAYAQGTDIHIAPGQEKHLPHEAWHVAQQKQGRVKPTIQMKAGVPVNDDAGLENEADVMGAKAAEAGKNLQTNTTAQLKQNNSSVAQLEGETDTPVRGRSSSVSTEDPDMAFKAKNAGLISMSEKASVVLGDPVWANLVAGSDNLGTGIAVSGGIGGVTGLSGTATSALDGSGEKTKEIQKTKGSSSFVSNAEGDILSGIGSAISSVVSIVSAVKTIYSAHKGDENKIAASVTATKLLMEALKSGFEAGMSIQKFVSGSVTPGIVSALPGLGLAINAASLLINGYNAYASRQNEKDMTTVSDEYRVKLTETLGKAPESHTKLFQNEKRGKFGNRITYLRLLPEMMERMDFIKQIADPKARTTSENAFKTIFDIPSTVNFDSLYLGIRFYEMGSKMQEINQKRKVAGSRSILTGLIKIAGDIASFFPGPGSVVAGSLKGAAAGIEVVQSASKFLQKQARDRAILGGDANRSTSAKHKEYVSHAKSIYYFIDNIPKPITSAQEPQLTKAEQLLKSTGVFLPAVYRTDYTNSSQISTQVGLIVESMKAGR